jgi:DNA-binding MarR family transcriptional regulator
MFLLPRLQATMPAVVVQAREKLARHNFNAGPEFDKVVLFAFYRLAASLTLRREPITMREVSAVLETPLSSATRLVDALVENGFVERVADPQDRRVVRIALTDAGKALHNTAVEFFNARLAEFLSHFDALEREQLLTLFEKTIRILEELNPPTSSARSQ